MYVLYNIALGAYFLLGLPVFLWRAFRTGKYLPTLRERMGHLPEALRKPSSEPTIWVHAVSVGEVLAARGLVRGLKSRFPTHRVLLSTTTLTGNQVARQGGLWDGLFFAPFDWPGPVRRVLEILKPRLLLLVETEIWPNLIRAAGEGGAKVAVVNGRISPRSYSRYRRIRFFLRNVLEGVDLFLMQAEPHADRLRGMGAPPARVSVSGNLKFDAPEAPTPPESLSRLISGEGPLVVAGSTADGEEKILLEAYNRILRVHPTARLLLAPRHPERFDVVPPLIRGAGFQCLRRSQAGEGPWGRGVVLLLDTLGELAQVYPAATIVFVGGSLVPSGGHNVVEAAVAGKAVIVGPHMENFQEIADDFGGEGALLRVGSGEELASVAIELLSDERRRVEIGERARAIVLRNRGALQKTVKALEALVA